MKYALVNAAHPQAMRLQGIGIVLGTPAGDVKVGDRLMWNFGYMSEVLEIVKETPKTITVKTKSLDSDYVGEHKMGKSRLVCITSQN